MKTLSNKNGKDALVAKSEERFVEMEKSNVKKLFADAVLDFVESERDGKKVEYTFSFKNFTPEEMEACNKWMTDVLSIIYGDEQVPLKRHDATTQLI